MTDSAGIMINQRTTRYEFCALPFDHPWARDYTIQVERRPDGLWAVTHMGYYMGEEGEWAPNFKPSYPLDEALLVARKAAPKLEMATGKVADILAKEANRG